MNKFDNPKDWLTSKQAEKALHVDSCELMHLRLERQLRFHKKRNAFMYLKVDVEKIRYEK